MSLKSTIAIASAFIATAAFAQTPPAGPVGTVGNVQGIVTMTDGATGGTAAPGRSITSGMRFVTTSSGTVTLQFNSGCTVTLRPNQALTVVRTMTCPELVAAVQNVAGTQVAGGGSIGQGLIGVGGVVSGAYGVHKGFAKKSSISAN